VDPADVPDIAAHLLRRCDHSLAAAQQDGFWNQSDRATLEEIQHFLTKLQTAGDEDAEPLLKRLQQSLGVWNTAHVNGTGFNNSDMATMGDVRAFLQEKAGEGAAESFVRNITGGEPRRPLTE